MDKWIEICRRHVEDQIEAIKNGKFNLCVPAFPVNTKYNSDIHYHATPEMSSQICGERTMRFPSENIQIKPNDICVIPALLPHYGEKLTSDSPALSMIIAFESIGLSFLKGEGKPGEKLHATEMLTIKTQKKESIKYYMNHICDLYHMNHEMSYSALQGILLACFSELRMVLDEEVISENYSSHPKVSKAQRLVMANLGDTRLNVEFISQLIPCSQGYLSQLFHRNTGMRLSAYINKKRLEYSKQLLRETNLDISEIAYSCGYSDPSYFARIFRKQTGMPPVQYRKH